MSFEPQRRHYYAIFTISLALLMLEIAVARMLSVALVSYFAFVAISLAMFGIGLSGLLVYLAPDHFRRERLDAQLVSYSSLFAASAAICVVLFLQIKMGRDIDVATFVRLTAIYTIMAIPFFFGGVCVSLLMTHCASRIDRIYFADLVGASLGCLCVIVALEIASAPVVAVSVAVLAAVVSLVLAFAVAPRRLFPPAAALAVVLSVCLLGVTAGLLDVRYVKGNAWPVSIEHWNSFSRVTAFPSPKNAAQFVPLEKRFPAYAGGDYPETMVLDIDGGAWTPLTNFDRDFSKIEYLRGSLLYVPHHLRAPTDVLIIGIGAGRDVLAAKLFDQRSVTGIELNPLMRRIVEEDLADYSGRPYSLPGVEVFIDEARSKLTTMDRKFGILQLSLIDTFSLNAAGGLVFAENYLYTQQAFQEYFQHLEDDGIFAVTRYYAPEYSLELLRLAGVARVAWEAEGIQNAADHIVILGQGVHFTILAKRTPHTAADMDRIAEVAAQYSMKILYRPGMEGPGYAGVGEFLTTDDFDGFVDRHPFLIGPPTDDQPFFFHLLRGRLAAGDVPGMKGDPFQFMQLWQESIILMYMLVVAVCLVAALFFFGPLLLTSSARADRPGPRVAVPLLIYFAALGYGFMMFEIPLMQGFILFLGYPVYALAVVLLAILFFSGVGSLLSSRLGDDPYRALLRVLPAILIMGGIYLYAVPAIISALLGIAVWLRIAVTVILLAPMGLVLGMAYPLGIGVVRGYSEQLVAWAWGMNGALSVVASVFAVFIGSRFGFSAAFQTGIAAYGIALVSMLFLGGSVKPAADRDPGVA